MTESKTKTRTPREAALAEVDKHAETVGRWGARKLAAEQELESLKARAGAEVLADENAAGRLTKAMGQLRDEADIATRAVDAAQPLLDEARRAAVLAEADEWDAEATKRRRALERHVAKIDQLLEQLRELDGVEYGLVNQEPEHVYAGTTHELAVSVREQLEVEVDRAELTAHVLREVAAGRDPSAELRARADVVNGNVYGLAPREYYPASVWGPDAVLPAPAYLTSVPVED